MCNALSPLLSPVLPAGDAYMVSSGRFAPTQDDGFVQVAGKLKHDPKDSMANIFRFAQAMLAASRKVGQQLSGMPQHDMNRLASCTSVQRPTVKA